MDTSNDSIDNATPVDENEVDDDDESLLLGAGGMGAAVVPVGITIAYKRQVQGFTPEKMHQTTRSNGINNKNASASSKYYTSGSLKNTHKNANAPINKNKLLRKSRSLQMFLESAAIYAGCLILPTLLAYFYSLYDSWSYKRETGTVLPIEESLWYIYVASSPNYQWLSNAIYHPLIDTISTSSTYRWFTNSVTRRTIDYLCVDDYYYNYNNLDSSQIDNDSSTSSSLVSSYAWSLVATTLVKAGVCPLPHDADYLTSRRRSVLSDDVSAYTDAFTIAVCSFLLALVRIAIIRMTVPIENSDTLEAMVRCKSVHLLSSDYILTPVSTPLRCRPMSRLVNNTNDSLLPILPSLLPPLPNTVSQDDLDNSEMFGYNIDGNTDRDEDPPVRMQAFAVGAPLLVKPELMGESLMMQHDEFDEVIDESPVHRHDSFGSDLLNSLTAAAEAATEEDGIVSGSNTNNRLYAAPRYATALFRLMYCTAATGIALYYFREADFWPWFVFGHGKTAKCWDLSGGLTVGMDSDFDQRNAVLKRYFLWQASYHWHSGAFHILSLLILLLHPTKHAPKRLKSFRRGSKAYVRSLFQHVLAVALIAAAYIFSSLRRLGAIGLFAFDVSSWFLHLLQVCINAPEDSRWRRNFMIAVVYWGLVIPSFVVTRFSMWPAIWYSATFESKVWLLQLERTLWPGSAALFRNIFHVLMVIVHTMSFIYFRRLFNHPHLKRILRKEGLASIT